VERPTTPPDPPLSDGVVTLRAWNADDVPAIVDACAGDDELAYWLDALPQPYAEADALEYVASGDAGWRGEALETPFAVVDADTGEVLGACGVIWRSPEQGVSEIGYWTRRDVRSRGVASRAVCLAAGWFLGDLGGERMELRADTRNAASIRVAEKAGFTREGVIRSARTNARDGTRVDFALYSLLRSELKR
jgi:RimJ/RimL family protein N-acetyltransferase